MQAYPATADTRFQVMQSNLVGTTTTPEPEDCVPPAIEQFPRPMLGQNIRKHGGFILYLLIAAYTFLALAIVCDEFFVPSLDILCECK